MLANLDSGANEATFKAEDLKLLRDIYNPSFCDRRDEGAAFIPPNTGFTYVEKLRDLVREEARLREARLRDFLNSEFAMEDPGENFPASWHDTFNIALERTAKKIALYKRIDYSAHADVWEYFLQSAESDFDKRTEDGTRFRIYRFGSLEARTTQEVGKKETLGAVFSFYPPVSTSTYGMETVENEKIVKATEYVEWAADTEHHTYIVLETEKEHFFVTEKLWDGRTTLDRAPRTLEVRNSLAKVMRSTESCRSGVTVKEMRLIQAVADRPGTQPQRAERLAYARGLYNKLAPTTRLGRA